MEQIIPNLEWYRSISKASGIQVRCPLAVVDICPRYYFSISLLGDAGISTKIEKQKDQYLLKSWRKSDLFPVILEQDTMISGENKHFNRFCPEVSYDVFGIFASDFARYADEIDSNIAHKRLSEEGASADHWSWQWLYVTPLHYSDCSIFSILSSPKKQIDTQQELFNLKPNFYGIGFNLKEIYRRLKKRIKKQI